MYVINHNNGKQHLNLIVETKDHIDPEERRKISAARHLFDNLKKELPNVYYRPQLSKQGMDTRVIIKSCGLPEKA